MIVVDVEATGLDTHTHSLVSIGAVDFRNPENRFYVECQIWEGAHLSPEAMAVNGFTEAQVKDTTKPTLEEAMKSFLQWVELCEDHMLAGQNPSFDRDFLRTSAERYHINWPLAHRTIDLHSVCWYHIFKRGLPPPIENKRSALNLDKTLEYVGIPKRPEGMPHNALTDALVTAEALHRLFYDKSFLKEFEQYPVAWSK